MASSTAQVSASISPTTKEKLDRFTEERGLKKSYVVEQALLYFIASQHELPDEALIPRRLVLNEADFERVAQLLNEEPAPTPELRELMRGSQD